mgnify:FL=1
MASFRCIELPHRRARIVRCESDDHVLVVPERVDGLMVTEIGDGAFAGLLRVREIDLPSSVVRIGDGAFVNCIDLRRLRFPTGLKDGDPSWLIGCERLEDVVLPGAATSFSGDFLSSFLPKRVMLGAKARRFAAPDRWAPVLREFAIDADNLWLGTDGTCLYSRDGKKLLSVVVHRSVCDVADGCEEIARKAFADDVELKSANLPDSLVQIGASAFAGSGLIRLEVPESVRSIGSRAFSRCDDLRDVELSRGLESIGDEAFAHCCSLVHLSIPATVREMGVRVTFDTRVSEGHVAGEGDVGAVTAFVFADDAGVLYRRVPDGTKDACDKGADAGFGSPESQLGALELIDASALTLAEYRVLPGTRSIGPRAFFKNAFVQRVSLPEGVKIVGERAFAECASLFAIELPDTVEDIGERAFCGAPLKAVRIPRALARLGERAFGVVESGVDASRLTLRSCQVAEGNERFFVHDGLLCERLLGEDGENVRVIVRAGADRDVSLPEGTVEVAPYAFAGAWGIDRLFIPRTLRRAGIASFALAEPCQVVEIERTHAWHGQQSVVVRPPQDVNGLFAIRGSLATDPHDARGLSDACDQAIFISRNRLVRSRYMVERLLDPLYLAPGVRKRFYQEVAANLAETCREFAKVDERTLFRSLVDLGFIHEGNITRLSDAAASWGNVAASALLLDIKHARFGHRADFTL